MTRLRGQIHAETTASRSRIYYSLASAIGLASLVGSVLVLARVLANLLRTLSA
jgi:hypothetical protein